MHDINWYTYVGYYPDPYARVVNSVEPNLEVSTVSIAVTPTVATTGRDSLRRVLSNARSFDLLT